MSDEHHRTGTGAALGMVFGIAIGAATDNVGAWLAIGLALGAAFGAAFEGRGPSVRRVRLVGRIARPVS